MDGSSSNNQLSAAKPARDTIRLPHARPGITSRNETWPPTSGGKSGCEPSIARLIGKPYAIASNACALSCSASLLGNGSKEKLSSDMAIHFPSSKRIPLRVHDSRLCLLAKRVTGNEG